MNGEPMPQNPLKWLLRELPKYLDGEALDQIQSDFELVKRRYDLTIRIRAAGTEMRRFQQAARNSSEQRRPAHQQRADARAARIKRLEAELAELDIGAHRVYNRHT